MGSWGDGIFQNDKALDAFQETFDELLMRLRRSVDPSCVREWDQMERTRALAHMVGLVAAGSSPHNSYTRLNAIDWQKRAITILRSNLSDHSDARASYVEERIGLLSSAFSAVIANAAPDDSEHDPEAFEDRYAIWSQVQKLIEQIDRNAISREVLNQRSTDSHEAAYWDALQEEIARSQ